MNPLQAVSLGFALLGTIIVAAYNLVDKHTYRWRKIESKADTYAYLAFYLCLAAAFITGMVDLFLAALKE
jgi:hypothetical protein